MSRFNSVAVLNCPLWTQLTPNYTVALLGALARARGFEVIFPELEIHFFHAVTDAERERWEPIHTTFWDHDEQTDAFYARYAESFFAPRIDALLAAGVDIFAFHVNNRAIQFTRHVVGAIKQRAPEAHIILGGPTAFSAPARLWEIPGVDAVCLGEGDLCFPDYLSHLREQGAPRDFSGFAIRRADDTLSEGTTPERIADLSALPFPDYSTHDLSLYREPGALATSISRGCIQRCSYCAESPHFGRFRYRSGENLFREVEHHFRACGLQRLNLLLNDSVLNGRPDALEEFADHLILSGLPVTFGGMAVARKTLTPELLGKLKRAGCNSLSFGIESGSPDVLRLMNKKQTPEAAGRVLEDARAAGITTTVFIIVGFPGETELQFYETLGFLRRNFDHIDQLMVNRLLLLPGSRLAESPERFGLDPDGCSRGEFRTLDGTSTPEIRVLRQELLYLLFQEKMALLQPLGGEGANPVSRLCLQRDRAAAESARLKGDILSLKKKCHLLLGMLAGPGGAAPAEEAGPGRAAA